MDVSSANFETLLPRIQEAINSCDIISFDCEFSGLNEEISKKRDEECSFEEVYERIIRKAGDFEIIQFGLTTFHQDPSILSYTARTFNFYIFHDDNQFSSKKVFSMHPSAIKFLSDQNFNFNKIFNEGIPYLSKQDEENFRIENTDSFDQGQITKESSKQTCITAIDCSENKESPITSSEAALLESRIAKQIGFRKVIDLLIKAQKPMVGHNCMLDLCHVFKQFISNEFPQKMDIFIQQLHTLFPIIYDTKFLYDSAFNFRTSSVHESSLSALDLHVSESDFDFPKIAHDFEYHKYSGAGSTVSYHEAGYDSYITGKVFLKLVSRAASEKGETNLTWEKLSSLEVITKHENKTHIGRGKCIHIRSLNQDQ